MTIMHIIIIFLNFILFLLCYAEEFYHFILFFFVISTSKHLDIFETSLKKKKKKSSLYRFEILINTQTNKTFFFFEIKIIYTVIFKQCTRIIIVIIFLCERISKFQLKI